MTDYSRQEVLDHLSAFADGQFDLGISDVFAVVDRHQFDCVPGDEEANSFPSAESLPYMKRWQLQRGLCIVFTDEAPSAGS